MKWKKFEDLTPREAGILDAVKKHEHEHGFSLEYDKFAFGKIPAQDIKFDSEKVYKIAFFSPRTIKIMNKIMKRGFNPRSRFLVLRADGENIIMGGNHRLSGVHELQRQKLLSKNFKVPVVLVKKKDARVGGFKLGKRQNPFKHWKRIKFTE